MTGRERILAAFRGEIPDMVPFAPNLYYWFYSRKVRRALPEELAGAEHPFDALRALGADILARWDTQHCTREVYADGEYSETFEGDSGFDEPVVTAFNIYPPRKSVRRRIFRTPYGTLTHTWQLSEEAGADFETEHWWKRWEEYRAVRFLLEARDYEFDRERFQEWVKRAGGDGVVMVHLTECPLKTLHWLAGPEQASLFIADHPDEMKELARIHERKVLAFLERIVDYPECEIFITLDNLDSAFYPPYLFRDYCRDFFAAAAEIVHSRGKILCAHACGRQRKLLPLAGECRIDCLEGLTPPPMGNVELGEARELTGYEGFTVNGGMDASRMEVSEDAEGFLHGYTRELFASMGDKRHFIYASSCTTSLLTPWENLKYARDAARKYGRIQ